MKLRFSLPRYARGHIALGVLALALFALSLWRFQLPGDSFWYGILGGFALVLLLGGVLIWRSRRALLAELNEIRQSEQRYALVMRASDDGLWDWKVAGDELYVSPRLLEMFDFPADTTFAGRAAFFKRLSIPPADREALERAVAEHFAGDTARMEIEFRAFVRGEERWMRATGGATRDTSGAVARWNGAVRDVTVWRRAEEALRRSKERFRSLSELSSDFFWETDAAHRYTVIELGWAYTGVRNDASKLGLARWEIPYASPDEAAWAAHRAAIAARERFVDFRFSRIEEGEERFYEHSGEPRYDSQGKFLGYRGVGRDVTARKRAEEALRESEQRYELAMAASESGYWDWHALTDQYFVSPKALELAGFAPGTTFASRADFLARNPMHPEDRARWDGAVKDLVAGKGERLAMEVRYIVGGKTRWHMLQAICRRDDTGKVVRWTGSATDVTARKQAVDTLRESESRFRTLVELNSGGFWEQDENLRYTPSAFPHDITGYSTDDRVGKTRWELCGNLTPLSSSWGEHQADLAARRPFRDFEYRRLRPDGEIGYYSASGAPFFDDQGRFRGYYGVASDITERKRFEEQLRSRQEMLELAQKSARAIAFEWKIGAGEGENRWSPDLEAMYGFKTGTYDGTFEAWKKLVHPDDWPAVKEAILLAHRTGDVASEYRVVHLDGSVHWLQAKGRMLFDASGSPTRTVGFMQDITERKQTEEELGKMEQELRRVQRLEAMGTLAGGIAHDFNNILGAILGYGEMAMRDAKKGTRLRRDLDSIMAAGERGRALIDRILAFSRSAVGERVPVHVEEVVREALHQVAANLPENVTITPRLRAGCAAMLGDSTQVHQVVMNLANNAVHAMPQGGVLRVSLDTLCIEAPRAALIGTVSPGDHIVLVVNDAGTGIRPEVLERMFDPFFTTKEVGVGSGLGLSLVHGIVANLGGAIDVTTELGKGTSFTVYLPRRGDAAEKEVDEDRALPRGDGERVLVVDDEESLVRLATETLESLGYAPVGFTSSANALQEFGANPGRFDAILTDERMPGVTGSAIIREVRRINASIPILLMSGFVGGAAALKARELGATDVLKKPLLARELATSLARALQLEL